MSVRLISSAVNAQINHPFRMPCSLLFCGHFRTRSTEGKKGLWERWFEGTSNYCSWRRFVPVSLSEGKHIPPCFAWHTSFLPLEITVLKYHRDKWRGVSPGEVAPHLKDSSEWFGHVRGTGKTSYVEVKWTVSWYRAFCTYLFFIQIPRKFQIIAQWCPFFFFFPHSQGILTKERLKLRSVIQLHLLPLVLVAVEIEIWQTT